MGLLRQTSRALVPLSIAGCLQTVDLRDPSRRGDADEGGGGDPACATGERIDPSTSACAPCSYDEPRTVCPCEYTARPAGFPYCDEPDALFTCNPACSGDISSCNAFAVIGGVDRVSDCGLLSACCDALAVNPLSTPCCPTLHSRLCFRSGASATHPFTYLCLPATCCETTCGNDDDCDTTFQTCQNDVCVPGCNTSAEYCHSDGTTCSCRDLP